MNGTSENQFAMTPGEASCGDEPTFPHQLKGCVLEFYYSVSDNEDVPFMNLEHIRLSEL